MWYIKIYYLDYYMHLLRIVQLPVLVRYIGLGT